MGARRIVDMSWPGAGLLLISGLWAGCADGGVQPGGYLPGLGPCGEACCDEDCSDTDAADDDDDDDDDGFPGDDKGTDGSPEQPDEGSTGGELDPFGTGGQPDEGEDEDPGGGTGGAVPVDPDPTGNPMPSNQEVCYMGEFGFGGTCFDLVEIDAYDYPSPINSQYHPPVRYLDVENVDLTTSIAPNFKLSEICVPYKGRYQVVQRHALESLQDVRDVTGALVVKSGFRSPPYNAQQPGAATSSRHMFGDAFDLVPQSATQTQLKNACDNNGADYTATYTSGHVHCDWRNTSNDPLFFGPAANYEPEFGFTAQTLQADLHLEDRFAWVDASGFDDTEGELTRSWIAFDREGNPLGWSNQMFLIVPDGAVTLQLDLGSVRTFEFEL